MVTFVGTTPPTYYGLSTDTKPTQFIQNGAAFIEIDSSKLYFFDQDNASWEEWSGESYGV